MGPASRQIEAWENRVYWIVWIKCPGTSEPQKYKALVDTDMQCTLIPSGHVGAELVSIAGVTGESQQSQVVLHYHFRDEFFCVNKNNIRGI